MGRAGSRPAGSWPGLGDVAEASKGTWQQEAEVSPGLCIRFISTSAKTSLQSI